MKYGTYRSPLNTSYAWDISHALTTLYHPYAHDPSALTEYLKRKLQVQHAKRRSRSHPAQVEQNVPLERNINSDLHTLATIHRERLERRGERNVPKRYLKNTEWAKQGPLGAGYYIGDPDDDSEEPNIIAVDFNFQALQWGLTYAEEEHYILERPTPIKCGLRIFDEERTPDQSRRGPLDRTPDEEENPDTTFKFGSDTGGDTPDPDIAIPLSRNAQEEESKLAAIAQLIPSHISKPPIQPRSLAGAMAQIATTTTLTSDSLVARTLGTGVSRGGTSSSVKGILQSLFPSQHSQGDGSGDDPPEPDRRDTGKRPI